MLLMVLSTDSVNGSGFEEKIKTEQELMKNRENGYIAWYGSKGAGIQASNVTKELTGDFQLMKLKQTEELRNDHSIIHLEENKKLYILNNSPNDPYYAKQWGLHSIMTEEAWSEIEKTTQEESITVAVIDSGIDVTHEDLKNRIDDDGYNFILDSNEVYDLNGHGTAVSGVIAAKTNNSIGISGVVGALDVKILPLQTADYKGVSYLSDVLNAINYAIEKEVDVINLSLGSNTYSDIENEMIQKAINKGIIVIAAAGNNGNSSYVYPASYNNVISVGSTSRDGTLSSFSNSNDKVDFLAPGEKIYVASKNNSYAYVDGTSFSSPIVSGIVAALLAIEPSLDLSEIKDILTNSNESLLKQPQKNDQTVNFLLAIKQIANSHSVPVEKLSLNRTALHLQFGHSEKLLAEVSPTNATNQTISWVSSNPSVAVVDSLGNLVAVGEGEANIIAITEDGGKTAVTAVTVLKPDRIWGLYTDVAANKTWTIELNQKLDSASVNEQTIYIFDDLGNLIDTNIKQVENTIEVTPLQPYLKSKYYLFINDGLLSNRGVSVKESILLEFTVN